VDSRLVAEQFDQRALVARLEPLQLARQSRPRRFEDGSEEVGGRELAGQPPSKWPSTTSGINRWSALSWGSRSHPAQGTRRVLRHISPARLLV
jgi:hypothetical protein